MAKSANRELHSQFYQKINAVVVILNTSYCSLVECDFVAMKNRVVAELVQVCYELTHDNVNRELNGLYKAMRFFNRQNAKIVTFANTDSFTDVDFCVEANPAYKYLGL